MAEAARPTPAPEGSLGLVLLVDDNGPLRRAFGRGLQRTGHRVIVASTGAEALVALDTADFDLVLTDVRMPDMDGVELLRRIRELDADLPVMLMSGAPDLQTAMKAVELGALEYLQKPIPLDKLEGCVRRALELRQSQKQSKQGLKAQSGERAHEPTMPSPGANLTGKLLDGRYRLGVLLGRGGMGAVYEAEREDLGRSRVAVKVLEPSAAAQALQLARFRRESETVSDLDHPNIVRVIDFRIPPDGAPYLVMERLYGAPLGEVFARDGRFTAERAASVAQQVLLALGAAHEAQVVHRDLKPDNVFLTTVDGADDVVKILDFGIAKLMGASRDEKLTQTGSIMGTPAYMSPEQARGQDVDPRTDLYAVGCLLYEAVTGRVPFPADNYNALISSIIEGSATRISVLRPDLDPAFAALIHRAMARDPGDRFQSAADMVRALAPWLPRR